MHLFAEFIILDGTVFHSYLGIFISNILSKLIVPLLSSLEQVIYKV